MRGYEDEGEHTRKYKTSLTLKEFLILAFLNLLKSNLISSLEEDTET